MKFKHYLIEKSFTEFDIPRTFRVVFDINSDPNRVCKELSDMKLKGLTGISDRNDIAFHWLGVNRDAMLIMRGKDVVKLNNLTRFQYDNPHYFFSKGMWALKRLFQKGNSQDGALRNILEYLFKVFEKHRMVGDIHYSVPYQTLAFRKDAKTVKIDSIKDFYKWFMKAMKEEAEIDDKREWSRDFRSLYYEPLKDLSYSVMEKMMKEVFQNHITRIYKSEGEWVVKDNVLRVPPNSYLYILIPKNEYKDFLKFKDENPALHSTLKKMDKWAWMIERYEGIINAVKNYNLEKKYTIKYIDNVMWKKIQAAHLEKK